MLYHAVLMSSRDSCLVLHQLKVCPAFLGVVKLICGYPVTLHFSGLKWPELALGSKGPGAQGFRMRPGCLDGPEEG